MKKRGAIHVDWVISMSIFLIYLIVLLVLIKPSYKAEFEGDVLTNMIKDEFLRQNKIDAGFVVFKAENCGLESGGTNVINKLSEKTGSSYFFVERLNVPKYIYRAYFFPDVSPSDIELGSCEIVEVGEVVNYNGLIQNLNFDENENNFVGRFPEEIKYKITELPIDRLDNFNDEPLENDKVYVLELAGSKLFWEDNKIKRDNVIINIQIW